MNYNNFKNLCNIKCTTPNAIAKKIGLSNSVAAKWKKGVSPTGAVLSKLADELDCSVDYLLGREENNSVLSSEEQKIINAYRENKELQDAVKRFLGVDDESS